MERTRRQRVIASLAITFFAALSANLVVANFATASSPTFPDATTDYIFATDGSANDNLDGLYGIKRSPNPAQTLSPEIDDYLKNNDIMFYPYNAGSSPRSHPAPVGCDLNASDFSSNPLCKHISEEERIARLEYKKFVGNPVYKCADGRNAGIDWRTMHELRPCPTGAARLRLSWGKLRVVHTTDTLRIHRGDMSNGGNFYATEHGWDFWLSHPQAGKKNGKTVYHYDLAYVRSQNITPYKTFVRKNGGDWDVLANLDDRDLESEASYDIVITWTVPGRKTAAWLPISDYLLRDLL